MLTIIGHSQTDTKSKKDKLRVNIQFFEIHCTFLIDIDILKLDSSTEAHRRHKH